MKFPRASIIIPTHGRPQQLRACVSACQQLNYPADALEILVIDDASPTPAGEALEGMNGGFPIRVIRQPHGGPARARNYGLQCAAGQFVAFLDDDCQPEPDWLRLLVVAWKPEGSVMVGGLTVNSIPGNVFAEASQYMVDCLYDIFERNPSPLRFFTSNNLGAGADALRLLNGFDDSFPFPGGEDRDLCERWSASGGQFAYAPGARIRHFHNLGLKAGWRQHFRYGRGARLLREKRARTGLPTGNIKGFMPYLATKAFSRFGPVRAVMMLGVIGYFWFAEAAGYAAQDSAK